MFSIDNSNLFVTVPDFPLIVSDYEVLHFDEMPILFTGVTKYNARVLGSSVEEDDEADRFFHVIVSAHEYSDFLRRRLSYRSIILQSGGVFVVDKHAGGRRVVFLVSPGDIPDEYLPDHDSYCPERFLRPSLTFNATMRGKRADLHQIYPSDLRVVEASLSGLVSDALVSVSETRSAPRTLLAPYASGSFRLKFTVEEDTPPQIGFATYMRPEYARLYIDFCLNRFQDEVDAISEGDVERAPHFARLLEMYQRINMFGGNVRESEPLSPSSARERLLASVRKSVDRFTELSDILGGSFNSLELFNVYDDSGEALVGTFDSVSASQISASIDTYDVKIGGQFEDVEPKAYEILIYNLNTETRRGSAYMIVGDLMPRVRISIAGTAPLEETKFTESLYKSRRITVLAKARGMKDKVMSLRIEYM